MGDAPPFTGVVLCGGRSRRMGRDKALLPIGGVAMARRVADALVDAGAAEVLALGGDLPGLRAAGLDARADAEPGEGPFPATVHALELAGHPLVIVVACDLVAPSGAAFLRLVSDLAGHPEMAAAVPVVGGHHQWTHAAWRTSARPTLVAARRRGIGSLKRGTTGLELLEVRDLPPGALADADTPAELPPEGRPDEAGVPGTLQAMELPEIDVNELDALRAEGVPIIDVREDDEYLQARVPGTVHIPLGEVADRVAEVPRDQTVYVICARGGRSAKAAEHYRSTGIDAVNVAGGTLAWIDAGYPTDSGPGGT